MPKHSNGTVLRPDACRLRNYQPENVVMFQARFVSIFFVLITLSIGTGCADSSATAEAEAPATAKMPSSWLITANSKIPSTQISTISKKLGGEVASLRKTIYEVHGKPVQMNTIVANDFSSANRIWASLLTIKSKVALLRQGSTIYEFIGTNDVLPEINAGKAHLQANTPKE